MKHIKIFCKFFFIGLLSLVFIVGVLAFVILPPFLLVSHTGNRLWWLLILITIAVLSGIFGMIMQKGD